MVDVVAGRRYAVVHPSGKREEGVATAGRGARFYVAGWAVERDGTIRCAAGRWVEEVATPAPPSTEVVHVQDAELLSGLPPHAETRLRLRQLQALERAAGALETIACLALDALGPSDEEDDGIDETGTAQ